MIIRLTNIYGNISDAGDMTCPKTAFPGNESVFTRWQFGYGYRLYDVMNPYGSCQFL